MLKIQPGWLAFVLAILPASVPASQNLLNDAAEPLNIIILTSHGGTPPFDHEELKKYGNTITSAWTAYARGRKRWYVTDRNLFGPINVDAYHPDCDQTMSNSQLEASIAPLLEQLQGTQKLILHFHNCGTNGTYSTNGEFYTYFHFNQTMPGSPGDGSLPGVSVLTRGAMYVQSNDGNWGFANDGLYYPFYDFYALGPGLPFTHFSINGNLYSILGQGQNSLLPIQERIPSAANLDINNQLKESEKRTYPGGSMSMRLNDYTDIANAGRKMVARIPYQAAPPLPQYYPLPQLYVYVYYRRNVGKLVFDYGPIATGSTYYGAAQQFDEIDIAAGTTATRTLQHVPSFGGLPVHIQVTSVDPQLKWVEVRVSQ